MLPLRQFVQVQNPLPQPLFVGLFGRQLRLDLIVFADATGSGIHEEHPTGLQPTLADDLLLLNIEDTSLGGQHHQSVIGHPEPTGTQSVAVQHGTDHGAVGEGNVGGTVPGLHE